MMNTSTDDRKRIGIDIRQAPKDESEHVSSSITQGLCGENGTGKRKRDRLPGSGRVVLPIRCL